ncbi:hypothetical protein P3342_010188 [Pyrenophora teres f. teres]|nr:hypothetical protein P3342_010188 [Pyrenophora teres f. teres]
MSHSSLTNIEMVPQEKMRRRDVVIEEEALAKRFGLFGRTQGNPWSVALAVSGLVRGLNGQQPQRKSAPLPKARKPGVYQSRHNASNTRRTIPTPIPRGTVEWDRRWMSFAGRSPQREQSFTLTTSSTGFCIRWICIAA